MEEHGGKSIKEALEIQRSKVKAIDLSNPSTGPALRKLGLPEHARTASQVIEGFEKETAAILRPDDECALPQQHGNLTGKKVLRVNYDLARRGGPKAGNNVGYKLGDLGTTTNSKGKTTDKAIGDAARANDNLGEHNAERALNLSTKIPMLVLNQGKKGKMPAGSIQLINENDDPIDHRNKTKKQYRKLVGKARGFELENTASYKALTAQIYPKDVKKFAWSTRKKKFHRACTSGDGTKFEVERFDDQGVLPGTEVLGPTTTRRKLAKYRFRLTDEKQGFEY